MLHTIKAFLFSLIALLIFGCNKVTEGQSLPAPPVVVEAPPIIPSESCTMTLSNNILDPQQKSLAIVPTESKKKSLFTFPADDPLAEIGDFFPNEFIITLSITPAGSDNLILSTTRINEIKSEQAQFINLLKEIDPKAIVSNSHYILTNSLLITNLSEIAAKEIQKRGYDIRRNAKAEFQGIENYSAFTLAPDFTSLASLVQKIGLTRTHSEGIKGRNITIGFIDSGVQSTHPDFQGRTVNGKGYCGVPNNFTDSIGHGTHVTSIAAGNFGIAPEVNIRMYQVRCLGVDGILSALEDAIIDGVRILNMSFSMREGSLVINAINNAVATYDVVVVAAAGNCDYKTGPCEGSTAQGRLSPIDLKHVIGSPGSAKRAITVGASSADGVFSRLISLTGPAVLGPSRFSTLVKPDLVAPGLNICAAGSDNLEASYAPPNTTFPYINGKGGFFGWCDSSHAVLSGTSMSAPVVSGAVALIKGVHTDWNADEIKSAIKLSADKMAGDLNGLTIFERGQGQLNIQGALDVLGKPPVSRFDEIEYEIGSSFSVTGSAYDRDTDSSTKLKEFRIYYGKGRNATDFKLLKTFSGQVKNGKLFNIAISNCATGEYLFKLEVEDYSGQVSRDFALINYSPQL